MPVEFQYKCIRKFSKECLMSIEYDFGLGGPEDGVDPIPYIELRYHSRCEFFALETVRVPSVYESMTRTPKFVTEAEDKEDGIQEENFDEEVEKVDEADEDMKEEEKETIALPTIVISPGLDLSNTEENDDKNRIQEEQTDEEIQNVDDVSDEEVEVEGMVEEETNAFSTIAETELSDTEKEDKEDGIQEEYSDENVEKVDKVDEEMKEEEKETIASPTILKSPEMDLSNTDEENDKDRIQKEQFDEEIEKVDDVDEEMEEEVTIALPAIVKSQEMDLITTEEEDDKNQIREEQSDEVEKVDDVVEEMEEEVTIEEEKDKDRIQEEQFDEEVQNVDAVDEETEEEVTIAPPATVKLSKMDISDTRSNDSSIPKEQIIDETALESETVTHEESHNSSRQAEYDQQWPSLTFKPNQPKADSNKPSYDRKRNTNVKTTIGPNVDYIFSSRSLHTESRQQTKETMVPIAVQKRYYQNVNRLSDSHSNFISPPDSSARHYPRQLDDIKPAGNSSQFSAAQNQQRPKEDNRVLAAPAIPVKLNTVPHGVHPNKEIGERHSSRTVESTNGQSEQCSSQSSRFTASGVPHQSKNFYPHQANNQRSQRNQNFVFGPPIPVPYLGWARHAAYMDWYWFTQQARYFHDLAGAARMRFFQISNITNAHYTPPATEPMMSPPVVPLNNESEVNDETKNVSSQKLETLTSCEEENVPLIIGKKICQKSESREKRRRNKLNEKQKVETGAEKVEEKLKEEAEAEEEEKQLEKEVPMTKSQKKNAKRRQRAEKKEEERLSAEKEKELEAVEESKLESPDQDQSQDEKIEELPTENVVTNETEETPILSNAEMNEHLPLIEPIENKPIEVVEKSEKRNEVRAKLLERLTKINKQLTKEDRLSKRKRKVNRKKDASKESDSAVVYDVKSGTVSVERDDNIHSLPDDEPAESSSTFFINPQNEDETVEQTDEADNARTKEFTDSAVVILEKEEPKECTSVDLGIRKKLTVDTKNALAREQINIETMAQANERRIDRDVFTDNEKDMLQNKSILKEYELLKAFKRGCIKFIMQPLALFFDKAVSDFAREKSNNNFGLKYFESFKNQPIKDWSREKTRFINYLCRRRKIYESSKCTGDKNMINFIDACVFHQNDYVIAAIMMLLEEYPESEHDDLDQHMADFVNYMAAVKIPPFSTIPQCDAVMSVVTTDVDKKYVDYFCKYVERQHYSRYREYGYKTLTEKEGWLLEKHVNRAGIRHEECTATATKKIFNAILDQIPKMKPVPPHSRFFRFLLEFNSCIVQEDLFYLCRMITKKAQTLECQRKLLKLWFGYC